MAEEEKQPSFGDKVKDKLDKAQRIFLISNVCMTLIFAANSILKMMNNFTSSTLQFLTLGLLGAYVVAFIVLVVLFNKDKKSLKANMKNYKFAIKVMKQVVNIMNLALAFSVMAEAFTEDSGAQKIFALFASFLAIAMAVMKFIFLIVKFIVKKKLAKKKEAKKALREQQKAEKNYARLGHPNAENEIAVGSDEEDE